MKPTIEQIGDVPFPPKIPTLKEELNGNAIVVEFTDGTVTEYEFDGHPSAQGEYASIEAYKSSVISHITSDVDLTKRLQRYFIHIQNAYIVPL